MKQAPSKPALAAIGLLVLLATGMLAFIRFKERPIARSALAHAAVTEAEEVSTAPAIGRRMAHGGVLPWQPAASVSTRVPAFSPAWHPRPSSEWQGMLVDMNATPPCEKKDSCGLALACKGRKCLPCEQDLDCSEGEACVLDHCVRRENVACGRAADCQRDALCVLSGFSSTVRGNEDMRAQCVSNASGAASMPPSPTEPPARDPRKTLPNDALIEAAKAAARRE